MNDVIERHPASTYVALTFAISWGGVLIVVGPGGFPGTREQFDRLLPLAALAMIAGPSVSAIAMTALVDGTAGLRELLGRLLKWRVGAGSYTAALLIAPLLMFAVLLTLSMFSPQFLPGILVSENRRALVLSGTAIAVAAGTFEELGWTGFAIPRLRRQHGVVTTGLIVGFIWAAWHVLVAVWASGSVSGELSLVSYVLDPFLFLLPFRVLMVWLYDRSGSLLLAMLMHVSLTASARIIGAAGLAGLSLLLSDLMWFAAVWAVVAVIAVTNGRTLPQQPLQRQAA